MEPVFTLITQSVKVLESARFYEGVLGRYIDSYNAFLYL
jgi:hypothetical protein